jgi:hypothetical protein
MTFEEWEDTRVRAQDGFKEWLMRDNFGYVPAGWQEVWTYAPGIIVRLDGDTYFTHIGRSEYTGSRGDVERRLWDDYAKHEVG